MLVSRACLVFASWLTVIFATIPSAASVPLNDTEYYDGVNVARASRNFYLRVMPLGASITYGLESTRGNGYRKALRDQLRYDGWPVNMVGTLRNGEMSDSDVEGWSGFRVDQVMVRAQTTMNMFKPNIVLINAGTNDATQNFYVDTTGSRMNDMIDYIFSVLPDTVIVLSTLIPNTLNQGNVDRINRQYRSLAGDLRSKGKHIILAEMSNGWLKTSDLADTTHPNDGGYEKMASVWHDAILEVEKLNWLKKPSKDVSFSDDSGSYPTCEKVFGSGNSDPRGKTQMLKAASSNIIDDGKYVHQSKEMGVIAEGKLGEEHDLWFAQLVNKGGADRGGELDDLVWTDDEGLWMRVNEGGGVFGDKVQINPQDGCIARGIRWGDVNNDGLDDFICIGAQGNMYVSLNRGGNPPQFQYRGLYKTVPKGYSQTNVRLGDIDGDGRLDYCVVAANGDIYCWRNGGQGDSVEYWQDLGSGGPVFTGKGMGDIDGVCFVDLNGDFRSDWVWLDINGKVTTYINQRGGTKNLIPNWDSSGVTHAGTGLPNRSHIKFGRVYGSGRADYMHVKCKDPKALNCPYEIVAYQNQGNGGAHQKGDGAFFCDMDGNGNDDYLFVTSDGKVSIFRNQNTPPATSVSWGEHHNILITGVNRKSLHFADWDGDGKCDVISTTKSTGAIDVWYTSYDAATKSFSFSPKTRVAGSGTSAGPSCTEGWGVGRYDLGMRFADIDGDGRADYLCIEKNGRVTGWLNTEGGMIYQNQIKHIEGKDRANLRFADINGDGRADFLWIDKFTGDAHAWVNMGQRQIGGSTFWWDPRGKVYQGSSNGPNMHFPNLGGEGRADMLELQPKTAYGYVWFNSCPSGGDDGEISDPGLPHRVGDGGGDGDGDDGGDPENTDWRGVTCNTGDISNPNVPADERWKQARASAAWDSAAQSWRQNKTDRNFVITFPEGISWFFDGGILMKCGTLTAENGCGGGYYDKCSSTEYPAGHLILSSFRMLNSILWNFRSALIETSNDMATTIDNLVKDFAPVPDKGFDIFSLLDIVMLGYGAVSSPMWGKVFSNVKWAKKHPNSFDSALEGTNEMMSTGLEKLKNSFADDKRGADDTSHAKAQLQAITHIWGNSTVQYASKMHDGSDDSIETLGKLISDGNLLMGDIQSINDQKNGINLTLHALLIPMIWRTSSNDYNPFVIDSTLSCDKVDDDDDVLGEGLHRYMKDDAFKKTKVCIPPKTGRAYFLVHAPRPKDNCWESGGARYSAGCNPFPMAPGADKLVQGLKVDDIVHSAVNTYKKNNKNLDGKESFSHLDSDEETIGDITDLSIRAPYMNDLPMCRLHEAFHNYFYMRNTKLEDRPPYYPCNEKIDYD